MGSVILNRATNDTPAMAIGSCWLPLRLAVVYSGMGRDLLHRLGDEGHLLCGRTPGGHRRWDRDSIDEYLRQDDRSVDAWLAGAGL